jgi:hypothetical protein
MPELMPQDTVFTSYLESNRRYFGARLSYAPRGVLLVDPSSNNPIILNATLRLAVAVGELKQLQPIIILPRRRAEESKAIIKSFPGMSWVSTESLLLRGAIRNLGLLWRCLRTIRTPKALVELCLDDNAIGKHIYDALLRRHEIPTLAELRGKMRFKALAEVAYYLGLRGRFFETPYRLSVFSVTIPTAPE